MVSPLARPIPPVQSAKPSVHLFDDDVIAAVAGNAPREVKEIPLKWLAVFRSREVSFAKSIAHRIKVVEVSVVKNPDDRHRIEGKVVFEIDVTEDMLNESGSMHEGCAVFLIDETSVCSLATLNVTEKRDFEVGVSQFINTVFHNPAKLGTKLRIIWDAANHQLVASGVQLSMVPSRPSTRP
ncbi:hypothetical protein E4T56_gene2060 [Termitomyces sp. T112]|nr:hypothetical protein E4T56_gene2060 [Termitomyces sp. T112]